MKRALRILVCTAQVPFARGGAELLSEGLCTALRTAGHQADIVALPFTRIPHRELLSSALAWRMLDLSTVEGEAVDMVICTKFPSYAVAHPCKVVWLVHQYRQLYDLYGSRWSDWGFEQDDAQLGAALQRLDRRALGEARRRWTISGTVSERLSRFNQLSSTPLYPPSVYSGRLYAGPYNEYILSVARLDQAKRIDLLLRALALTEAPVRAIIVGSGAAAPALQDLAQSLNLAERVQFTGYVSETELLDYYAHARAVFYAPVDEDFGLTTIEALEAARPVLTCSDSGAVLEFIRDGVNGFIVAPEPQALATRLDLLWNDPFKAAALGAAGPPMVAHIRWPAVVQKLLSI